MPDDGATLKSFVKKYPDYEAKFNSAYENCKVLKTKSSSGEDIIKHCGAPATSLSRLYLDEKVKKQTLKLSKFVAALEFPKVIADICKKLTSFTKGKCYTNEESSVQKPQEVISTLALCAINFSDLSDPFCIACEKGGLIPVLVDMVTSLKSCTPAMKQYVNSKTLACDKYTVRGKILSRALGVMHNLSKRTECRQTVIDNNGLKALVPYLSDDVPVYSAKALLALAYLIDENNNNVIMASATPIQFLIKLTDRAAQDTAQRRCLGFSTSELADGLAQIASNDKNNKLIGLNGAIPVLVRMLKTAQDDEERENAALALWRMAFDSDNRAKIAKDTEAMNHLRILSQSSNSKVKKNANGALWEIEGKQKAQKAAATAASKAPKSTTAHAPEGHVMISYQWDVQDVMIQVKELLQANGYHVWMDIDQMEGSTLEAMANAVEKSAVVLMCASRKYKDSVNCRSEAEYAYTQKKPIVPLMMENGYKPDGWLGMIMGSKLYFNFAPGNNIRETAEKLMREIGEKGKSGPVKADVVDASPSKKTDVSDWDVNQVVTWMNNLGLEEYSGTVKQNKVNGAKLKKLAALKYENAKSLFKEDWGMDGIDAATLAENLKEITGN
ncbi:uncharacterized protein LOC5504951 [Nematostella vectensis]|uniref:uncharacterized protein LOC5504951 n=1 Tax=Nematostella vectensis TaxID=45351 RepID=UPI002077944B|nr:uncharacterized protein LOC5504951 [Nematostella vectensis]